MLKQKYSFLLSTIGAILIFFSVIIIFSFNLIDKKTQHKKERLLLSHQSNKEENQEMNENIFKRILFYKF